MASISPLTTFRRSSNPEYLPYGPKMTVPTTTLRGGRSALDFDVERDVPAGPSARDVIPKTTSTAAAKRQGCSCLFIDVIPTSTRIRSERIANATGMQTVMVRITIANRSGPRTPT